MNMYKTYIILIVSNRDTRRIEYGYAR